MCFKLVLLIFFILNSLQVSRMEDYVEKKRIKEDDYGDKSSIVFVFDTTGSMYNDLVQLKDGAGMILKTALDEGNFIADFVFVPFHDPAVGPATVTRDIGVFKTALNQVKVYGGGDCPEKSLGGIEMALNVSRPRSYIYVFTDATASDHKLVVKVLDSIQRKQSQVVFVLTGHCNDLNKPSYKVYPQIAAASSGQVFNLNKTSVHKVLEFVKTSMKSRAVNLGSLVNPAGYNHTQEIPVDSTLGEVTVSVSGAKPQLKVVNPSGVEITGPPQLVTTLDLSEIVVVKVLNPEPGSWSITVGSEDDYSVKVVGLSNLTFNHGFSVEKPKSMVDTSYRPLQGTYNYMVISLTEIDVPVDIETAEILNLDGKPLFEIPLQKIDSGKQLYMTKFLPPDEMFYIAIKGHDEQNLELKRIGATAVQVKLPDVPYLTASKKVEAKTHEDVVLRCDVESLVPIRSMWLKDNNLVQGPIHSLQTTSIEYKIEDMGEHHVGMYRCVSKNSAGISDTYTELIMTVDPPQVNVSLVFEEYPSISCTASSDVLLEEFKLLFNSSYENNSYSTDIEIEPSIDGFYTYNRTLPANETENGVYICLASNRGGQRNATAHINTTPIAQIIGPHTINKRMGTDLQLVCSTEHALSTHWVTPKGVILTEEPDETGSNRFRVSKYPVETGFNVVLDARNVTEGGNFTCVASKGKHSVTDFVHINVLMKPEVRIEGAKNLTIMYGDVHRVVCKVRANPAPRIVWHRETERFLNNLMTSTEGNVYTSILHLNNSAGMNATYFCIGENSEGIDQDSVVVNVRKKMILLKGFTDESVQLYSQIELNCLVDSYPPARIKWYHNGTDLQTKDNVRISEDCTTVYIQRVEFTDLGLFSCEASNGFESVILNGTLSVYGLEIPLLSKEPTKIVLREGQPVNISCRIIKGNPEPMITWQYRRDSSEDFTVLHRNVEVAEDTLSLEISNVRIDYSGEYRCIAQNDVGSDVYSVELTVQFAPKLLATPDESNGISVETKTPHLVEGGEKITFSCKATGIPPPIVIWTKDRQPIHYSNNLYLTENNELIIEKADISNSGLYTCNATSVLGSTHKNFSLVVYVPPKIIEPGIEPEQEFLEGQLVELPCRASGAPKPKLEWLHNGRPLTDVRKYIDQFGLRFVANLTDFGVYTCVASNQYGNTSSSFTVYIWVTPYIEPPLDITVEVLISSNATLNCDAVGFPVPKIYWQFNGELLTENTTNLSFNDRGNVYIKNAKETQEGMYICVAENLAGVAYKHIQFNVNVPPKIISDNMTKYIATDMDTSLVVSCRATGKPKPYVLWIKDGIYIDKDSQYDIDFDGLLTIKQPSVDLSGSYICVAKNSVGSDNKTITIDIYSLPQTQAEQMQTTMTLLEGASVDIECPVRDKYNSQVQWYKEAKLVATGSLRLENVTRHSTSQYACVATNAVRSSYAVIGFNVEWPPSFVRHAEENFKLIKGEDIYLDCEVDAKPMARTKWLFNSKPILGEDSHRLKLLDVKLQNTGTYKCIVGNKHGTIFKSFILDVIVPPYISSFDLLDVKLKEGTNATLECNAVGSPEPKVSWTYNNTKWRANHTSLTIANVTSHSEGLYRCDATNEAGATHIVYRVDVVQSPVVRELILYQHGKGVTLAERGEIVLGTNVRLSCQVNGKPTPHIKWIRNGAAIGVNARDIHYADLLLDNVQIKDSGIYFCVASNEGGVIERRITLHVLEPPKIFQTLFDNSNSSNKDIKLEVISGQAYYMHCHPYGNPLPEIYWFKDGLPLRLFDETMISTDFGEIIVSKRAFEEQSGNYTCVARNKVGETSIVYLVDILVPPPEFKDSVKQISTRIGFTLNLTCPVEGTPVPNVMWFKQPYIEINEQTPRTQLLYDNITLIINATETADTGRYTCVMTNKVGATEFTYDVIVHKTPSIAGNVGNNNIETHTVSLKRSIVLKCEVDGHPMPMIKWLKDTQELSDKMSNVQRVLGNSLLTIWSATSRDGGQYICIAENNAGTAHRRYNVLVKVPGKWSEWSQWSYCNVTCGLGYQQKSRYCHYIDDYITIDKSTKSDKVVLDETVCKGPTIENRKCHMPPCEVEESQARWSIWSKWSQCSSSCGAGTQARTRRCRTRAKCYGDNVQIRKCPDLPKCDSAVEIMENEVFDSKEEITEKNPYLPEATYELQPENIYSYNPDAEELHPEAAVNPPPYFEVNVTENVDYSQRGPCEPGYRHNTTAGTCDDIEECLLENNHCHSTQLCANTVGGYRCSCPPGYMALGVGQRCLDINECVLERDACEFACVNVAGGYVCACPRPLRLHADRRRCVTPSPYRAQSKSYEELGNEEYLSANIDFPAKYMKNMKRVT